MAVQMVRLCITGHKSRWLMIKRSDSTSNWFLVDTARDTYNVSGLTLFPNASDSEQDFVAVNPFRYSLKRI
jgi:hypothetical protein